MVFTFGNVTEVSTNRFRKEWEEERGQKSRDTKRQGRGLPEEQWDWNRTDTLGEQIFLIESSGIRTEERI